MARNRHDTWKLFCERHRELIATSGLPESLTNAEHRLRELLTDGQTVVAQAPVLLADVPQTAWPGLSRFASEFFRAFESSAPEGQFRAFHSEARKRGDYG